MRETSYHHHHDLNSILFQSQLEKLVTELVIPLEILLVREENLRNDNRPQEEDQTSSTFEVATQQQTLEVCAQNQASVVGRRKRLCTTVTNKETIYNSDHNSTLERRSKAIKMTEAGGACSTATAVPCLESTNQAVSKTDIVERNYCLASQVRSSNTRTKTPKKIPEIEEATRTSDKNPPQRYDLSDEELKRILQEQDQNPSASFTDRYFELRAFKEKFGHCNATQSKNVSNKPYISLGRWCSEVRLSRRLIEEGKSSKLKLTKAYMELLDACGFPWGEFKNVFDKRFEELTAFKAKFGHCDVTRSRSASNKPYISLGRWCSQIRHFRRLEIEGKSSKARLSETQIESLDALGFRWGELSAFDKRFEELTAFKAKFGHCDVSKSKAENNKPYISLGGWCSQIRRFSRRSEEEGDPSILKLTKDQIEMLNSLGFRWGKIADQLESGKRTQCTVSP